MGDINNQELDSLIGGSSFHPLKDAEVSVLLVLRHSM